MALEKLASGFQGAGGSGHRAVDVAKHIEPTQRLPKDGQERIPVDVFDKVDGFGVAAVCHVIDVSREFYAKRAGHGGR